MKSREEKNLQSLLLAAIPRRYPNVRAFDRNVGKIQTAYGGMFISGIPGQCDVYTLSRGGMHAEIELKSATGRVSEEQRAWLAFCGTWEIPHRLLIQEAGETYLQTIERWLTELGTIL